MRRLLVSFVLTMLLMVALSPIGVPVGVVDFESNAETISITYYFSEPKIQGMRTCTWLFKEQISDHVSVTMEDLPRYGEAGLPVLPFKTARILLPFGRELQFVKAIEGKKVWLPGSYLVEWAQEPLPLSYQGSVEPTLPDKTTYNSPYPFPGELYSDVSVQSKTGYKILLVNLHPVQYIPKTGKLFYHESIKVEVDVGPESDSEHLSCRALPQDREIVKDMVDNPKVIGTYPLSGQSQTYEYVIITNEWLNFTPGPYNFAALRNNKISRGISATIVTTEWIYENYTGTRPDGGEDDQTKIRNFIIDAYNSWGTRYVLLGGDGDGAYVGDESGDIIIPHRGFASVRGEIDCDIPADMYYACLDGTFDYDADGIYGEPNDGPCGGEVDLFAEVYIGRACVDSWTEVRNFVNKTLAYQALLDSPELRRVFMVGEYVGFGGVAEWGGNYKDEIKEGSDAHGYTTIGFENSPYSILYDRFDVSTLYDRDWPPDYDWPKSEIINVINSNIHLLNHLGHASVGSVMKMGNDDVDYSLTNEELYFIGYSQGCYCGSFDNRDADGYYTYYDCISEHLTTEASGAVAFISNSRYGWGVCGSTNGPSQHYDREFWDAVLGEDVFNIGIANQDSKEDTAGWISSWVMRWCYYEVNLFGDPELSIKIYDGMIYDSHEINDEFGGDDDGYPEPDESIKMPVTLRNTHFAEDFTNVTATISATTMLNPEIIFYEDFEADWPGNWIVGDSEPENGTDYWGKSGYRAYSGSWSAYCAGVSDISEQEYDDYMYSYMNRPVDLFGYDIATLSYYYWLDSETCYDYLMVGYYDSVDSRWHWSKSYTGYVGDWVFDSFSIPTTATDIGFLFDSDFIITCEGAYVDEITLTAYSLGPDPYITITHDYEEYGNIPAGDTATSFGNYSFEVALDCPEDHVVTFDLEITADNGGPWTDSFEVTIVSRYSIFGVVWDLETGIPIIGATVHYCGPVSGEVRTDEDGIYEITGLVEGTYTEYATADGYSDSDPIEVTLPPEGLIYDFELGISDVTVTPLEMKAILLRGETEEQILTIENTGNYKLVFNLRDNRLDFGSIDFNYNVQAPSGDFQCYGVEFDGDRFYVSGGNSGEQPNKIYVFDRDGNYLHSFDQASSSYWGWLDLTWDGSYLYAGEEDSPFLFQFLANGTVVDAIFVPRLSPCLALAYDPETDHFWTATWDSPIFEFDRNGSIINEFNNTHQISGMAWDHDPDGPWLWVFAQEEPAPYTNFFQFDPRNGTYTGVSFCGWGPCESYAGGACFTTECDPSFGILVGLTQTEPDSIVGYEICLAGSARSWLDEDTTTGTITPSSSMNITVTFNATDLDVGEYEADIIIESNDPDEPTVIIPVRLIVAYAHNVAVTNVLPSKTVVGQGYSMSINVTVENQGVHAETFNATLYHERAIPNGDFEKDPAGTSYNDISDWNHSSYDAYNGIAGENLEIVDDYYFTGNKSLYSYVRSGGKTENMVFQYFWTENPVSTTADYISLWIGGDGYTTSFRYWWRIELYLTDGTNTHYEILRCDCWGYNEGCNPNHYDYYNATETGADGNTWKRYTRRIPDSIDKSNLTIKIRHPQRSWDSTTASSWYRLDNIYFSDSEGNPHIHYALIPIETKTVTNLPSGKETTITFTWNTTGVAKGNYVIAATATQLLGEIDTTDNTLIDGTVCVTIAGDVNGDGTVDASDLFDLIKAYGSEPGDDNWNPNCDLNNGVKIDASDLFDLSKNYGKNDP